MNRGLTEAAKAEMYEYACQIARKREEGVEFALRAKFKDLCGIHPAR